MKKLRELRVGDIVVFKNQWDAPVGVIEGVRAVVVAVKSSLGMPYLLEFGDAYVNCGLHKNRTFEFEITAGWWVTRDAVEALVDNEIEDLTPIGTMVETKDDLCGLPIGTPAVIVGTYKSFCGDLLYVVKFGAQFVDKGYLHNDDAKSTQNDCYRLRETSFKII